MQAQGGTPVLSRRKFPRVLHPAGPMVLPAVVVAADQFSKSWARASLASRDVSLIDGFLAFRLTYNTGAVFGVLQGGRWVFLALAPPVAAALLAWSLRTEYLAERVSAGLILGGVLGNSWDRLSAPHGRVTDFVDLSFWPAFNVADAAMVIGLGTYVVFHLVRRKKSGESRDDVGG